MPEGSPTRATSAASNVTILSDHLARARAAELADPVPDQSAQPFIYLRGGRPEHLRPKPHSRWTFAGLLELVGLDTDPPHAQPSTQRLAVATVAAIVLSVLADAVMATVAQHVFPATRGYVHFQFHDYARLTVLGVAVACAGWPVVTRLTSKPRWVFFRLAVVTTLVLWLPDVWILSKGQPAKAVAVLMLMHLVIAVATYQALLRVAPVKRITHRQLEEYFGRAEATIAPNEEG